MEHDLSKSRQKAGDVKGLIAQFAKQESGSMTMLAVVLVMVMLIIGGTGVDLMHNEMERTRMQAVADRAVLAAADLDQTRDPEMVVRDYFAKSGMSDFVSSVEVDPLSNANFRSVKVNAATKTKTQFMKALGVPTLDVPASATAEERVNKVEISLVLDISGSMKDNSRMTNMQTAAKTFVRAVLKPQNKDLISISLIPYSEHVNAGNDIFSRMNVYTNSRNPARCIEFSNWEFNSTYMDSTRWRRQMQFFQWNTFSIETGYQRNTLHDTVCPRNHTYEGIKPFSQNVGQLETQIDALKPRAGTQIFLGMKWATAMLDPSFNNITTKLAGSETSTSSRQKVDAAFSNRPAPFNDADTMKTVVLMTDGQNSKGSRISSRYYNTNSLILQWRTYNFNQYLSWYVHPYYQGRYHYTKYSESAGDTLLLNMCDAAKEKKIVIWGIGFETTDHGADILRQCSSSPSHFFRVVGADEIKNAFEAIASQINQLRLTQ